MDADRTDNLLEAQSNSGSSILRPTKKTFGTGWATSDEDELNRRIARGAHAENPLFRSLEPDLAPFGCWYVSLNGVDGTGYPVEIRSFKELSNSCGCADFRVNGLGTCKHIEALLYAKRRQRRKRPAQRVSEIYLDRTETPPVLNFSDLGDWKRQRLPAELSILSARPRYRMALARELEKTLGQLDKKGRKKHWRFSGILSEQLKSESADERISKRLRQLIRPVSAKSRSKASGRIANDDNPAALKLPLYAYQREGMLHLLTRRRAILADEMGLGKTVQAVAACALLKRLGLATRVLVVCPASLKCEWEEQIAIFTDLLSQIVLGNRSARRQQYTDAPFFTLTNYEQVLRDTDILQQYLQPDIIVLDEAQRIKNWQTKTANAIKQLDSRYAFVLTGTPLENRIDEIYSIMQFIDPEILGPLFRFNRQYYVLNDKGRPEGYKNLQHLHEQLAPHMLRRNKDAVEGDLPPCTVRNLLVEMSYEQQAHYADYEAIVARLGATARKRPLTPDESKRLQINLGRMRMTCDSVYILDQSITAAPKLDELEPILDELLHSDVKIIVFSEWQRMLELIQLRLDKRGVGYAVHTGSVPQKKRRVEIQRFKQDPNCRLFLSTESGGAGLNLQVASVVINLDLPWNPAKLAQRIARAWRKHQTKSVQVINFVTQNSIEEGMLGRLEAKQRLADGVLQGGLDSMVLPSGRGALLSQLEDVLERSGSAREVQSASNDQPPQAKQTLDEIIKDSLIRFAPVLQQVVVFDCEGGSQPGSQGRQKLLVVAAAEHDAIRQAYAGIELHGNSGYDVQVISPELHQQLQHLADSGIVQFNANPKYLVQDSRLTKEFDRNDLHQRLANILHPHQETLKAAALLEKSEFNQQAAELVQPITDQLKPLLQEFQTTQTLPSVLKTDAWARSIPTAQQLLALTNG